MGCKTNLIIAVRMKKLFFAVLVIVGTLLFSIDQNATPVQTQNGSTCVETGDANVGVVEDGTNSYVYFSNFNNYRISITWSVYGTDNDGNTRNVAGGNTTVDPNVGGRIGTSRNTFRCPVGVTGLWVEARIQKYE